MKQKDIVLLIVVIFFSAVVAFVFTQTVFVPKEKLELEAEVVEPISAEFRLPDKKVFNEQSINPTQLIQIGNNNNPTPF